MRERERDRERDRERQRDRERDRETDRDRERQTDRDRQTETDRQTQNCQSSISQSSIFISPPNLSNNSTWSNKIDKRANNRLEQTGGGWGASRAEDQGRRNNGA